MNPEGPISPLSPSDPRGPEGPVNPVIPVGPGPPVGPPVPGSPMYTLHGCVSGLASSNQPIDHSIIQVKLPSVSSKFSLEKNTGNRCRTARDRQFAWVSCTRRQKQRVLINVQLNTMV